MNKIIALLGSLLILFAGIRGDAAPLATGTPPGLPFNAGNATGVLPAANGGAGLNNFVTATNTPINIIYDDDCFNDVDCVFTLSGLHHWIDQGSVKVLAFVADSNGAGSAPMFKIFENYYQHTGIPIGTYQGTPITTSNWVSGTVTQFDPGDVNANYPSCTTVYRTALAAAANSSVNMVSTGFLTCIQQLMQSSADGISPLTGPQLIAAKVNGLYLMGGDYPTGSEFNMTNAPAAANYVFANWTSQNGYPPIYLNGYSQGVQLSIGKPSWIQNTDPAVYAVALAGSSNRPGWDILSVYQSIFGLSAFTASANGTNTVNASTGANSWSSGTASGQYYYTLTNAASYYDNLLDGQSYAGAVFYSPQTVVPTITAPTLQCNLVFGCEAWNLNVLNLSPYGTNVGFGTNSPQENVEIGNLTAFGSHFLKISTKNGPSGTPTDKIGIKYRTFSNNYGFDEEVENVSSDAYYSIWRHSNSANGVRAFAIDRDTGVINEFNTVHNGVSGTTAGCIALYATDSNTTLMYETVTTDGTVTWTSTKPGNCN